MNKKITVKRDDGQVMCCVLSGDDSLEKQFNIWLFGKEFPSGGYKAKFYGNTLQILDCIAYDTVTTFEVLSIEDTAEEVAAAREISVDQVKA